MKKLVSISLFPILLLTGCGITPRHTADLADVIADGSPPRIEREYKYSVPVGEPVEMDLIADALQKTLETASKDRSRWQAPRSIGQQYYADKDDAAFAYFDIYFDTKDGINYEEAVSYRLRERFKSIQNFWDYYKDMENKDNWPYRIEFQAKVNRQELGNGFSTVEESRFEFREESEPFSNFNPPPKGPWKLEEFIGYLQEGKFRQYYTWPAKSIVKYLISERTDKTSLRFEPELILVTERQRQHLNIKTPWGSGPNPEQAYIISLDQVMVYDAYDFLKFIIKSELGFEPKAPSLVGEFTEVEVEFERNVSSKLDEAITVAESAVNQAEVIRLTRIKDQFLADQGQIMIIVQEAFAEVGLTLTPANGSKYKTAYKIKNNL